MATSIHKEVEVEAPLRECYDQWTRFESFPRFMEGIEEVRQIDDSHVRFVAKIGGKTHEWDAEITEQQPDEIVSWRSQDGKLNTGVVRFEPRDATHTLVKVDIGWQPEGVLETVGDWVGAADRRVEGDLERFRDLVEKRGSEGAGWRGRIEGGERVD
jgi:uncharacterized membrane protein